MPMPPYKICCLQCGAAALYKIAARWSDGLTEELKTYALVCPACLPTAWRRSLERHAACRLAPGEKLDVPGVFELSSGCRDRQLERRSALETSLTQPPTES
jgi:hypothetical protein